MKTPEATVHGDHTLDRVAELVARIAAQHDVRGTIAPADALVDRGMTSMAMVDLMLAVEAEFAPMQGRELALPALRGRAFREAHSFAVSSRRDNLGSRLARPASRSHLPALSPCA